MSGENPVSSLTDSISHVLGTDGSHGGLLGLGEQLDKSVRSTIPGGWATLGVAALAIAAPYLAPELLASAGSLDATEATFAATQAAEDLAAGTAAADAASVTGSAALDATLASAGQGALVGGGMGGVNSAMKGTPILAGVLKGAFTGALTGASLSSLTSPAFAAELGLSQPLSTPVASALLTATKAIAAGGDPATILTNTAVGYGLSSLGGQANTSLASVLPQSVSSTIIGAATGATNAAIKGTDIATGAEIGAIGAAVGSAPGAIKSGLNSLTAPSANIAPVTDNSAPWTPPSDTALLKSQLTSEANILGQTGANQLSNVTDAQTALQNQFETTKGALTNAQTAQTALNKPITSTG